MMLQRLEKSDYAEKCVFKGGTSLSKCYPGSIERFSEDIDLTYLGIDEADNACERALKAIEKLMSLDAHTEKIGSERNKRNKSMYVWFGKPEDKVKLEIGSSVRPDPYSKRILKSYSIQVSNTCNVEDAKKQLSLLQNWILLNLPERLFKFFGPKNRNFEAVENDEIWGSTIDEFNDPYESLPYYSMERCEQELVNNISLDTLSNFVSLFKQGTIPNGIKSLAPRDFVDNISAFCSDLRIDDSYVVNIDSIRTQIQCWLKNNSHALISDSYANLYLSQRMRHIACFTEERDTTLMWGHYGGGHKGFCVEYDFTKILKKCNENCTDIRACPQFMLNLALAPVRYVEKRFDATPFLATVIMDSIIKQIGLPVSSFHSDTLIATKCLLAKSIDWSYEKEWRMLSMPNNVSGENHKVIAKVQASAVYMGAHTSDETRSRLSKICAKKGIPCYLMIQKYSNNEFNVDPVLYNEYLQWVGKQHELSLELEN